MLERETDTMIQILTEQTMGSAKSLALRDALATDIPKSIKTYLHREVARWLQDDLRNAGHFSSFRFTTPFLHRFTNTFIRTIALDYIFTREEFLATMENAVHFVENYLCRPQWTLEHFLFEKGTRILLPELRTKLEYLTDYLYFARLIEGYLRQKGWSEIVVDDFRSLLTKIDDQIVKLHSPREFAQLTRPIFEFILLKKDVANTPIPLKPLLVFFEDKKMNVWKEYVDRICHVRGWQEFTIEQLGEILEDMPSGLSNDAFPPRNEPEAPPTEKSQPIEGSQFQVPLGRIPEEPTPIVSRPSPPSIPEVGEDKRNIALSLTFSGMTESAQRPSPLVDLKSSMNAEQRERFIRTIFQNDNTYFTAVTDALNGMQSWNDASLYLQNFLISADLDPHLPDVIEFTGLVQRRYAQASEP